MRLIRQPNLWSCLPTSLAMVLSKSVEEIIDNIGHDGSEVCWPELPEPKCRRCFNMQEIIDVAILQGYSLTPIDALPSNGPALGHERLTYSEEVASLRINSYLKGFGGIITGKLPTNMSHAVAWSKEFVYDPVGTMYKLHGSLFVVKTLWVINSINRLII